MLEYIPIDKQIVALVYPEFEEVKPHEKDIKAEKNYEGATVRE